MSTPQPPSADQLAAARLTLWRQTAPDAADGSAAALLTLESARNFISSFGLLLFTPRPQHIASPAPSLVEATLGASNTAPSLAQSAEARALLARLISEGSVVPLNLLGAPSTTPDTPDFLASTAAFPYIFTLRGDKAFKQPPATSGPSKVSPLAINTYTLLVENGPTSAYDLATQLGKEVTEAAVLRSLNELWQHLRVLPVLQSDGAPTLWETVANRFTKQLKSGANAGQPTALSALISLYLSQALLATEADIETFLSPLAPRSRVRDVLHALTGARQLETLAVNGKTHLHIHGELPIFGVISGNATGPESSEITAAPHSPEVELAEDGTRIRKFIAKPRKIGTGYVERAKPFRTGAPDRDSHASERKASPRDTGARPLSSRGAKFAGKPSSKSTGRPTFNKPWDEDKQRSARSESHNAGAPSDRQPFQDIDLDASGPSSASFSAEASPAKRPFTGKARFGGDRPAYSRGGRNRSEGAPPRRDFVPREDRGSRPPRREFSGPGKPAFGDRKLFTKPGFADRKRDGFANHPAAGGSAGDRTFPGGSFSPRSSGLPQSGDEQRRPFRRDPSSEAPRTPRRDFSGHDRSPRSTRADVGKSRGPRDREATGAPQRSERPERPPFRKFDAPAGPRKPFTPREGDVSRPPRRDFAGPGSPTRKSFGRSDRGAPEGGREGSFSGPRKSSGFAPKGEVGSSYPGKRGGSGFAAKREGGSSYAGKKPFGSQPFGSQSAGSKSTGSKKPFAARPEAGRSPDAPGAGTFDKFKGGNKPWGKRPPGRKPKPDNREA